MSLSPSDIIQWGRYAYEIKERLDEHRETSSKLYREACSLIDELDDLEKLRRGRIADTMPGMDQQIAALRCGLMDLLHKYKKLIEKHHARGLSGRAKSYFLNANKVKGQIKELREDVTKLKIDFLVRANIVQAQQQLSMLETGVTTSCVLGNTNVPFSQEALSSTPSIAQPITIVPQRAISLKEPAMDIYEPVIRKKVMDFEELLKNDSFMPFLDISTPRRYFRKSQNVIHIECSYRTDTHEATKEEVAADAISLYRALDKANSAISIFDWVSKGHALLNALLKFGYYDDALRFAQFCQAIVSRLHQEHGKDLTPTLAVAFHDLAWCYYWCGKHAEAIDAFLIALQLEKKLAEKSPDHYSCCLAATHHRLGYCYEGLGKSEEAVKYAQESISVSHKLALRAPLLFRPSLSQAQYDLGLYLYSLGRFSEAATAAATAVTLRKALADKNPESFNAKLASAQHNLAMIHEKLGKHEEAVIAMQAAVDLRKELAGRDPCKYTFDLAVSLSELSISLSNFARFEEALVVSQAAVDLWRKIAHADSNIVSTDLFDSQHDLGFFSSRVGQFTKEVLGNLKRSSVSGIHVELNAALAASLHEHGLNLSGLRRHEEAIASTQAAVDLWREVLQSRPSSPACFDYMVSSMLNIGHELMCLQRFEDAIAPFQCAFKQAQILCRCRKDPAQSLLRLADSFHQLGTCFVKTGRYEDARKTRQACVDLSKELALNNPEVFIPLQACSTHELGSYLFLLKRHEEAVEAMRAAVNLKKKLALARPSKEITLTLFLSMQGLVHYTAKLGNYDEAVEILQDALDLPHRKLFCGNSGMPSPRISWMRHYTSLCLSNLDRYTEAMIFMRASVRLKEELARINAETCGWKAELASSLYHLGFHLSRSRCHEEAAQCLIASADIRRELARQEPNVYNGDLAVTLNTLGYSLTRLSRYEEAAASARDSEQLLNKLVLIDPERFRKGLGMVQFNLGLSLAFCGRYEEAAKVMRVAMDLLEELASIAPGEYSGFLTLSAHYLVLFLRVSGGREESEKIIKKANDSKKRFTREDLKSFNSKLGFTFHEFAFNNLKSGRNIEAVQIMLEAMYLWKEIMHETSKKRYNHWLLTANFIAGVCYSKLGQLEKATVAMQAALDLLPGIQIAGSDANRHKTTVRDVHRELSRYLARCGRFVEAAEHSKISDELTYELEKGLQARPNEQIDGQSSMSVM